MKRLLPFSLKRSVAVLGMAAALCLSGCLPGEEEVAKKYNNINQRTSIENTGLSLVQAANDMSAYLVAGNMVRRSPMDDLGVTTLYTVSDEDNPKPTMPAGIKVATCSFVPGDDLPDDHSQRKLSAVAYFVAQPKGIPALETTSATMAKVLSERFGGEAVGLVDGRGGVQYPKLAEDAECMPTLTDAMPFSPVFAAGFKYEGAIGTLIPDSKKTTWPSVYRDITIPCPSPYQGVVKREQHCRLITDESSVTPEEGVIDLASKKFGGKSENTIKRIEKTWDCDPPDGQTLTPTTEEIDASCRDPNAGLTQQAENTIQMNVDNIKELLDNGSGQYYTFKCRRNANGTNSCDTKPYNPNVNVPSGTFLRCDPQPVPEQYVINPIVPMQVDANGKVISETPNAAKTGAILGNRSCGQGWAGDLIAGYQVRACQLVKVVNGVQTPMRLAQTVYKIGYVGARCTAPPKEDIYNCPRPYDGDVTLRESHYMTKPLALQLGTAPAGSWTPSTIPYRKGAAGDATPETLARALSENYKVANEQLQGITNPQFSSLLEAAMAPDMKKEITGCSLTNQTCKLPPDPIGLGIIFDRSGSMTDNSPASVTSATDRMSCRVTMRDIFTDDVAACSILRNYEREKIDGADNASIEAVLAEYLTDKYNPNFYRMLTNAIQNGTGCSDVTYDEVGYCVPGTDPTQSSCSPGRCIKANDIVGTKLVVAEDQLQTAISYAPPGSTIWYTEFVTDNNVETTKTIPLCNYVTDDSCDFAKALADAKGDALGNKNLNNAGTPLMKATTQALEQQFGTVEGSTKPGILLFFTDGAEADGIKGDNFSDSYPYKFGSLCNNDAPDFNIQGTELEFCRGSGLKWVPNAVDALSILTRLYDQYGCDVLSNQSQNVCVYTAQYYNPSTKDLIPSQSGQGAEWEFCKTVGASTRPAAVDYIKAKFPNVKVFILNLGSPQLLPCFAKQEQGKMKIVDASITSGFQDAFDEAFEDLKVKPVDPEDVCQRIRARSYPNAASY